MSVLCTKIAMLLLVAWASKWLSDIFQLLVYHGENKLIFNEMMMKYALYY